MANKKVSTEDFKIGTPVTYVPNGIDYGSRPKNTPVPATVISVREREIVHPETKEKVTRKIYNLIVLQDTDQCHVRKRNVVHKNDALDGESYFE